MIDDAEVAELLKYAELLTVSAVDAIDIVYAAIRKLALVGDLADQRHRRVMLFRCVTEEALKRRCPTNPVTH